MAVLLSVSQYSSCIHGIATDRWRSIYYVFDILADNDYFSNCRNLPQWTVTIFLGAETEDRNDLF